MKLEFAAMITLMDSMKEEYGIEVDFTQVTVEGIPVQELQ